MNCPVCNAPDVKIVKENFECAYCGTILPHNMLICPSCRNPNPLDSDNCTACGEPLTLVSQVMIRHTDRDAGPYRLRQAREQAARIKESEERASELRFRELEEVDRRRIQAVRNAELERKKEQVTLLKIFIVIIIIFLLAILILSIRSAIGQ